MENLQIMEVVANFENNNNPHTYYGRIPTNSRGVSLFQYDLMQRLEKHKNVTYQNDWATFKVRAYFKCKKDGTLYSDREKRLKKNVKTIDSFDWIPTNHIEQYYVNEHISLTKLISFIDRHKKNAYSMLLFGNIGSKQYTIRSWHHYKKNYCFQNFANFKEVKLNGRSHKFFDSVTGQKERLNHNGGKLNQIFECPALSPTPYEHTEKYKHFLKHIKD